MIPLRLWEYLWLVNFIYVQLYFECSQCMEKCRVFKLYLYFSILKISKNNSWIESKTLNSLYSHIDNIYWIANSVLDGIPTNFHKNPMRQKFSSPFCIWRSGFQRSYMNSPRWQSSLWTVPGLRAATYGFAEWLSPRVVQGTSCTTVHGRLTRMQLRSLRYAQTPFQCVQLWKKHGTDSPLQKMQNINCDFV